LQWPAWSRDANGNGLDDELDFWLAHDSSPSFPVVICYDRMPSAADRDALARLGAHVSYVSRFLPFLTASLPRGAIGTALGLPQVARIEAATPLEPCLDTSIPSIGVDQVWKNLGMRGDGTVICIIDTGIDGNHTSLDDMDDNNATRDPKIIAFYDAASSPGDANGTAMPFDLDGHGTHVAGIAAGTGHGEPDFRYIGVAPGARLVGVKILQNGSTSMNTADAMRGIEWAMANKDKYGIQILSMSFGAVFVAPGITNDGTSAMSQLAERAVEEGLVVVAAAGNSGPVRRSISPPGDAKDVITVGNVQDDHTLTTSSSRGPVGKPGNSYIKPDVCAPGTDIYSAQANSGNKFVSQTGTSDSCPHVSGVAALMLQALPSLRPSDIMSILRSTAEPEKSYPWQSSPNNDYGYGTINALQAVENCTNGTLPPVVYIDPLSEANGTVVITGTASSAHQTIETVEVRIDSGPYEPAEGTTTWSYEWNTTSVPNGPHLVIARAFDGKIYSYEFRMVVQVDNLLVVIAPLPVSAALMGEIIFTGTADGNVQSVQVRIDNRTWENADDTSNNTYRTWQYPFNTTNLSNGVHHLEARAYDGSRYSTLSGLDFSVLNPKKTSRPAARFIPGMEATATAITALMAILIIRRRSAG
jgi:serine protease AprX